MSESSSGGELKAEVEGWRMTQRWTKNYVEYKINVQSNSLTWELHKRYSQWSALHKQLSQDADLKGLLLKLPSKHLIGNLNTEVVEQRCAALKDYLREIMKKPKLQMNPHVLVFLGALSSSRNQTRLYLDKVCEIVNQGDLILFRTDGVLQGIQRAVTNSEYDHVGIVVRIPQHSRNEFSLFILEATSDGVQKYALRSRLRAWHLSNAVVALRQLKMKRTYENMSALSKFVEMVDGKPYGLGPLKLLRRHSKGNKENYFCSELVASAFKTLEILPEDVPSTAYLPASFGDAGNLQLINHASLEREIIIDFDKPAVVTATVKHSIAGETKVAPGAHSHRGEQENRSTSPSTANSGSSSSSSSSSSSAAGDVVHSVSVRTTPSAS